MKKRIGVLLSGRGSNFEALADSVSAGRIPNAEIAIVVSNRESAPGIDRAKSRGIPTRVIPSKGLERETYDRQVVAVLNEQKVDLVCLAGYMRLLSPYFVAAFPQRILNIHPSLLPSFPGLESQRQALEYGVKFAGCTVHFVDENLDAGPIILQATVPVLDGDTEATLSEKILKEEHRIYTEAVKIVLEGKFKIIGRRVVAAAHEAGAFFNFKPVAEQLDYLKKGFAEIIPEAELTAKLEKSRKTGKPLRVYLGVDPTAPDIHLGHTVVLRKLKHFQDLGHTAIFLIGDFSAMIGDPTGQSETRPPLTREQVDANAKTYLEQVFKILDKEKTEVHYNSEWLDKLSSYEIVRLGGRYRLARMLEREDFHSRLTNNQPISVHELLYPLLTAWDAVKLESDVEIGATEQKFNLLVHRDIQIAVTREKAVQHQLKNPEINVEYERRAQVCFTMPILVGLDGQRKMSKSLGNYVGITEPPGEMFGKLMSIPDELMWSYYELLTDHTPGEIAELRNEVAVGSLHPMDLKMKLAQEVITDFHGEDAARKAAENFQRVFRDRQAPEEMPMQRLTRSLPMTISALVFVCGLTQSRAEAQRLVEQKAVELDGQVIDDPRHSVKLSEPRSFVLRAGKKKFKRVVVE